jgi:FkbH-like protein
MNPFKITPERVRKFLLNRYAGSQPGDPADLPDDFDFLLGGMIDSFGVLEMVGELEREFGLELDMSGLAAEQMTLLGPLSRYVSAQAGARPGPPPDPLISRLPESVREAVSNAVWEGTLGAVQQALSSFETCPADAQGPEALVQVLASFEVESIEPALRLGLRCIPSRPKLRIAPLNTIEQEVFNKTSPVYTEHSLATVVLWRADELMPDLFHPASSAGGPQGAFRDSELIARVERMVGAYVESSAVPLFLGTIPLPAALGGAPLGSRPLPELARAISTFNASVLGLGARHPRVHALDVNWWAAQEGWGHFDLQMNFMAKQPLTAKAAISFGFFLARSLRPLIVPRHKVLAVDLDNTLWGGILGEDGIGQLKLGHDFPGSVYLRIQKEILELKHQGVLLMLASKNDEASVRQAFEQLPNMLLRWNDFVCRKINYGEKYSSLRAAAAELGLGLDSFAFLDDSDFEREQMKTFNPEVLILNDFGSALHMLSRLRQTDAFDVLQVTQEDLMRHREYELRSARSVPAEGNLEEFLSSLHLKAVLEPVHSPNFARVVQMLGKTNQFNLTTRRHQLDELERLTAKPGAVGMALRLIDKFGDQGIVAVLLAVPDEDAGGLTVDSFLVSCRALSRGVEEVLWAELVKRAAASGVSRINGHYLPTAKNGLVAELYDRFGLKRVKKTEAGSDYVLEPVVPIAFPAWIAVERAG